MVVKTAKKYLVLHKIVRLLEQTVVICDILFTTHVTTRPHNCYTQDNRLLLASDINKLSTIRKYIAATRVNYTLDYVCYNIIMNDSEKNCRNLDATQC